MEKQLVARVLNFYKEFLTPAEKRAYLTLLFIRCISGILDLVGVLSIGYLATSIASFLGDGSNVGKTIEVAGRSLPAVTAASLPTLSGAIAGLFIAKAIISISITKFMAIRVARIEARAAQSIAKVILGGSLRDFKSVKKEELRFSIQVGTTAAFTNVLNAFASLVSEGFLFILLCAAFLVFNPLATLAMLVYFGLLILLMNFFVGKRQSLAARENYLHVVQANNALGDLISAFRELAVLQKRDLFFNEIYRSREAASKSVGQQAYLAGMPRYIIESGLVIGLGLFIWAQSGTTDFYASAATTGVFLAGGFRIVAALLPLQNALSSIRASLPQAQSTYEFLNQIIPESQTITETKTGDRKPIKVEFQNVSYSYDNGSSPALENINLVISPGQTVAFIGPSGAGKSTLADLIMGLETPTSGNILINGDNSSRALCSSSGIAGYVPQVPGMVSGTLAENIAIGEANEDINQINLQSAIKESHLEGLFQKLGIQLDSDIGEHGDRLSGGQKQRIGIARALYSRPGLLVLDEATSALDAESENEIIKTLRELRGKVTIITIAHRLNSIRDVDTVYVLDSGRIVDSGTLGELELSNPMVAKALSLLSSGEEAENK